MPIAVQEKTTSNRIDKLRDDVTGRKGSFIVDANPFERDAALFWVKEGLSVVQIRAAHLLELAKTSTVKLYPGWNIAGEHLPHGFGLHNGALKNPGDYFELLGVGPDGVDDVRRRMEMMENSRRRHHSIGEVSPERMKGAGLKGRLYAGVFLGGGWIENHSIRDYAKVIRIGYRGISGEIIERMSSAELTDKDYPRQENFWKAALWVCEAGEELGRRYAEEARKAGRTDIAEICARAPAEGARTLKEAVQTLWLAHVLTCGEDGINANSLGRLDQIFYPYYEQDRIAGRITREEAVELMEELACKLYLDYDVQAITIGGVDADGESAVNEMSHIILEATKTVDFARDLSVRLHKKMPEDFLDSCAELVAGGGGIPFFFNDECFIQALVDRDIALEDARNYAPIGCIELTVPGKANPHAVSGWFSGAKCLELALFNGQDPRTGEQFGPETGWLTDFIHYTELEKALTDQIDFFAGNMVYHINRGELAQQEGGPLPCWSVLTDDCIRRGRDITDGGSVYNYHSVCFVGTANIADSLAAVRKLVFEEKKLPAGALLEALKQDFRGHESIRQMLVNAAPKYGNGIEEVDSIGAWITNYFIDLMDRFRSALDGRFFVHLFSFVCHIDYGRKVGATPDGRHAGETLAYSLSAHQGRDENGVTALFETLSKLPHRRAGGATAAIIDLDPQLVAGDEGIERMSQIIRSGAELGIGQMQFNVVTKERLLKAKESPEKFGNFPVRVAGYSQKFSLLSKELQDFVIARTKHVG